MTSAEAALVRSKQARNKVKRRGLLFIQLGIVFEVLREDFLANLGGRCVTAEELCAGAPTELPQEGILVITDFEVMTAPGRSSSHPLGVLRKVISEVMEVGVDVCLVSRAPRVAFPKVPGSSIIEDASVFHLPLLAAEECESFEGDQKPPGYLLPAVGIEKRDCAEVFHHSLRELGVGTLASLDHALYETETKSADMIKHLDVAQSEALRGAGLLRTNEDGDYVFAVPNRINEFREALAHALADVVLPQDDWREVADGLFTIERMIRRSLRNAAIERHQGRWRKQVANHGDLAEKLVKRANGDAYLTALSVAELRDPIEWMSLGELLEVVRSNNYAGLGITDSTWQRFAFEVLPIRNRLSHMRLIKDRDKATITAWVAWIKRLLS
ncbi:hypothetical protein [Pseudarthrobacter sp. NamE5]|uniref:hypothetical protein n=1 Tax=Pseudarthrobacter sp. NamE5 TaxID=2576839 RepID=UPI00110AB972|nr:hypothetical protein [Pseudarthrobacter sp. NamE5]TLM83481.1 hypothetical protein FDW84_13710 [Pseudarthrobacter sp. NamE5]